MKNDTQFRFFIAGLLFSVLWASAATATKTGLTVAQPFVICMFRFFLSGGIMLLITHAIRRNSLPKGRQWRQLIIYGFLNIGLYLGLYVIAMQKVSAGLGALAVSSNPVFITLIAIIFKQHRFTYTILISLLLCTAGVVIAAYPQIQNSSASWEGVAILFVSMLSYSGGSIYFSNRNWDGLKILTINAWQTLLGGLFLLPLMLYTYSSVHNSFSLVFWESILWLAIPVSIISVLFWLYLLKENPVKASYWLFLCPVAGFIIARVVVHEQLTAYTYVGVALVIAGLYLILKEKQSTVQCSTG